MAATSLMLFGAVAIASSASADDNKKQSESNSNSYDHKSSNESNNSNENKNNNSNESNNSNENNNSNEHGNENSNENNNSNEHGNENSNENENGNSGDNGNGHDNHVKVTLCHATGSDSNPYVTITVDDSSINNVEHKNFNGHGTHANDIIPAFPASEDHAAYPGQNLGNGGSEILANGCKAVDVKPVTVSWTYCAAGAQVPAVTGTGATEALAIENVNTKLPAGNQYGTAGSSVPNAVLDCSGPEPVCVSNCTTITPTSLVTYGATAAPSAPLCLVVDGAYQGVTSVTSPLVTTSSTVSQAAAQTDADTQAQTNVVSLLDAQATGNAIIPPYTGTYVSFTGYNWTPDTEVIFNNGCSLNRAVVAAVPLGGTVAPTSGKPAPAEAVPAAGTPVPASVNAGGGSSAPGSIPMWALAMVVVGALGASASGLGLVTASKK